MWNKRFGIFIIISLITLLITCNVTSAQTIEDSLNKIKSKYSDEKFSGTLKMEELNFPDEIYEIKIMFFRDTDKKEESTKEVIDGAWSFQTDITTWALGEYEVTLIAHDNNKTVIGETSFKINIESGVAPGIKQGEIFDNEFIKKFKDKKFSDKLKMSKTLPDDVYSVQTKITKNNKVKVDKTSTDLKNSWSFETSVKDWDEGKYQVILSAQAQNGTILDTGVFQIKVVKEEPFYMPLVCAVLLIIFIVLLIVLFILSLLKNKKIMTELKFEPKNVAKKLPMLSYISMFITLLFVLSGLAACMTAGLDLIPFILFLVILGFLMLFTYWTFSNRNFPPFILYLILIILSLIVISLASVWSETDAGGLVVGSGLLLTSMILFFISILLYWLTSRRGFFTTLVTVILSLVFFILMIVFVILSIIDFFISWWVTIIIGSILTMILLLMSWVILRDDLFYFETREESQTHRGWRKTFNMFDIFSIPRGLLKREYDRKVMGKISFEQMHDKNMRMEVISLRDWETLPGQSQGRRLMGEYVKKMRSKEGPPFNKEPVAKSVKFTIYSSDVNLEDKLNLCRAFGFKVQESGRERGLDYYELELVHRPFLGLGTPMGSPKKKKDYDKESGYARDKDKERDEDHEHRYDYEYDRERRHEKRERESKAAYERDRERERERERYRDEEPEEDLEDWDSLDRGRGRGRRRERERYYEPSCRERHEPPPEKPKKKPPPPRIVSD